MDVVAAMLCLIFLLVLERTTLLTRGCLLLVGTFGFRSSHLVLGVSACAFFSSVFVSSGINTVIYASIIDVLVTGVRETLLCGQQAKAAARAKFFRKRGSERRAEVILQVGRSVVSDISSLNQHHYLG